MRSHNQLENFVFGIEGFLEWSSSRQMQYFAYYLHTIKGLEVIKANDLKACFEQLDMSQYSRIPQYLSDSTRKRPPIFVKKKKGYRLERRIMENIANELGAVPKKVKASQDLIKLASRIQNSSERAFLEEAINCYKVQANRATIVMIWILVMGHLQRFIFDKHLSDFNKALAKANVRSLSSIRNYDDFSELKESRIIELARSAKVISNDVKKILDEKLGIRNSAGHPAGVTIGSHKTTEFVSDLVENILLKYK